MKKLSFILFVPLVLMSLNRSGLSQWSQTGNLSGLGDFPRISVVDSGVVWLAGCDVSGNNTIYKTENGGLNWISVPASGFPNILSGIAGRDQSTGFITDLGSPQGIGGNAKIFKTTNSGLNWRLTDSTGGTLGLFNDIQFSKTEPLFGVAMSDPPSGLGGPFYLSSTSDGGNNWTRSNAPGIASNYALTTTLFVIDHQFYGFMTYNPNESVSDSYITVNGGASWQRGGVQVLQFFLPGGDLVFADNKLTGIMFSPTSLPNIKRTTNGGLNWVDVNTLTNITGYVTACWISGTNTVFICGNTQTLQNCVIRSNDGGLSWVSQNTSSVFKIYEMDYARYNDVIVAYCVSSTGHVLKSRQSVQTIGIQQTGNSAPSAFSLSQNYPNPFNPKTIISYQVSKSGNVSIKVYNVLGNEVATLAAQKHDPGTYEVEFDGSDLTSGVYFYRIETESFTETKRMLMLK